MNAEMCPICFTAGAVVKRDMGDNVTMECPICTHFVLTGSADAVIGKWTHEKRLLVSGQIRRHWNDTKLPLMVTSELVDGIEGAQLTSVVQKQNALLQDLARLSLHPGAKVNISPLICVVFDGVPGDELGYHITSLIERGLLSAPQTTNDVIITARGWEHVERLLTPPGGNRSDFFVAMAFKDTLRDAWEHGISPGAADAGYVAKRVDSDAHNDRIDDRIIAGIRACFGLIAEVTTQNVGAYFEAGFALGLGRPVVWTVHADDVMNLHFDTRQFNHIVWKDEADLRKKLGTHLLAVFGRGPVAPV
jgi:hypothetical protein